MKTSIKFHLSQTKSPPSQPHKTLQSIEKLFAQKTSRTKPTLKNNFDFNLNLSIRTKNNKIISFDKNLVPNLFQCFTRRKDMSPNQIIPNGDFNNYIYTSNNNLNFEICNMIPLKKETKKKSVKKLIPVKSSKINLIDHNSLTLRKFVSTINLNNNKKINKLYKNKFPKNEKPTKLVKKCLGTPLTYRDDNLFLKQALTNSKLNSIDNQMKNELLDESKDEDNNNDVIKSIDLNSSSNYNFNNTKSVIKNYSTSSYKYGFIDSSINTDNSYLNNMAKNKKIFSFNKDGETMNNKSNSPSSNLYKINNKYLPPITSNSIFSTGVHKNIQNTFMISNELIKDKMFT